MGTRANDWRVAAFPIVLTLVSACASRSDFAVPPAPAPLRGPGFLAATPSAAGDTLGQGEVLTARRAIDLALARNPNLGAAQARVEAAAARLAQARSVLWPRLLAGASYLVADAPSTFLFKKIDARDLAPGSNFNDPGTFDNVEVGLTARWNLWNGGRDRLGTWAAEAEGKASLDSRAAAENELVAAVLQAMVDVRAAAALEVADEASVRSVEAQVEESRVLVAGGSALRSDLLSLEVRLAQARERRIRTDIAQKMAVAALRDLLVLPAGQEVQVAEEGLDPSPLPRSSQEALVEAYRGRREIEAVRRRVEAASMRLASAHRAYWPSIGLEARVFGDDGDAGLGFDQPDWLVTLGVSWELFDGGSRSAAIRQASAALRELQEGDRRLLSRVAFEVDTAWLRLQEARARFDVASKAVGAAEESFELVEKQYRGGAATVTRYLEAESERTRARTARIRARLDVDRATLEAARAIGRLGVAGPTGRGFIHEEVR